MKKINLLQCLLMFTVFAHAQMRAGNNITGVLRDSSSRSALEYGTVTIFNTTDKKLLTGTTTDKEGVFTFTEIPAGTYRLLFECIGYTSFNMNGVVINKKEAIIDLKNILLSLKKATLEGVTVVSQSKLIENKIDKIVFNAEKDVTAQSGVATDILKKIPQVSVDADGNVQLAGNPGIRFLINGKPSTAFGSNVADVLQSIPASQVKSVEVITNPGAKYDAQGMGGIINIILKSGNTKGYNGSLSLAAGTRIETGSLNLNVRKNNFGVNAFVSANKRLPSEEINTRHRVTRDSTYTSTLDQTYTRNFHRQGFQTGFGFDWTVHKLNNFSGTFAYNYFGFDGNGQTKQQFQSVLGSGAADILSSTNSGNQFRYNNRDISLTYKRSFIKEDQELEIGFNSSRAHDDGNIYNDQFSLPTDSLYYGIRSSNPSVSVFNEFNIDYVQPFKHDIKLGLGAKANFYNIESSSIANSYNIFSKVYETNPFLSNALIYKQKVYAAYAELSFAVAKLFDAKIGGRFERTDIDDYFSNAQQQVKAPGYNTFVPAVFLSKKIGSKQTVKLSYSKRIQRPEYDDLNPFINTIDPKNISTGNPYLKPETGHRFELACNSDLGKNGSWMINLFYRINDHDIQPYIVYYPSHLIGDSVYLNVAVNTQQNIGKENNIGLNLFADIRFTPKLSVRTNVFLFQRHTINIIDAGYNYNSFNYRFNVNASYQFTNALLAEFFGNFNSPRNEAQGKYPSYGFYSMAIRRQFWKKKGSVALTLNNFFNRYLKQQTLLSGNGFTIDAERKLLVRSIGINFAWKFGRLEFKKGEERESNANENGN
ncbi:MAG: TonB-dependent receptor [Ferruginibacter sp.]